MLTTDFSGTYDYEKEEAINAAHSIIDNQLDGYYRSNEEFKTAIDKVLSHWKKVFNTDSQYMEFKETFVGVIKNTLGG